MAIQQDLEALGEKALQDIEQARTPESLEQVRVSFLGKKGALSGVLSGLGALPPAERPQVGALANQWKKKIEDKLETKKSTLLNAESEKKLQNERIDVTLPPRRMPLGSLHPLTITTRRIVAALARLGFTVASGPEIETEFL